MGGPAICGLRQPCRRDYEGHSKPFERRMQSIEEQLKELRTAFDGECTVTMLRNKSVVAHMADVSEQLEEIKKTLDDFKTEADPQRIPGDIPDDVATFRDAFNLNPLRRDDVTPNVIQASEAIDRRKKRRIDSNDVSEGMKQKLKKIPKKVGTKIRSKVIATLLRMRHQAITCKNRILINNFFHFYGEMKRGREFPSVTSGQLHSAVSMSPIPSPTPSAPSLRVNEAMSQGTPLVLVVVHDHFDLDYTHHEDVRTVVETMMTARRTHRNRMHAYFKKFPSKEAALLKPHPDTTEEQWKELCDLFTSEAFMKRSEQNKKNRSKLTVNHAAGSRSFQRTRACMKNQESGNINPAELYKKNYTNKDGIWTSEGAREIYERMDAFQRQCDLEGKTYTEIEKQAEMEATLRDHREEQRVEQERIRLEQEEHMKREQERMRVEHEERMQQEQERMRKEQERLRAEISKELEKKMSSVMEKKMSDMSKRLFSQFGGSKR
ncbi:hypothetical protein CJ030_MR4G010549 [Morella rubra]|uniref:Uncharacterized protein n=1 Tax=Morella rubra TaxID=262757 RepID=A0A6A1VXY8_9ROSI|nr:hypothetical protein CJ030_MR4G010549 [Morella rubra]